MRGDARRAATTQNHGDDEMTTTSERSTTNATASAAHAAAPHAPSKARVVTGRVLSGLAVAFLLFDAAGKLFRAAPAVEGTTALGYPESAVAPIGLTLLACTLLHLIPRTRVLGAILLTGHLGGAVATHVRLMQPLLSHVLFPVYVGVAIWAGLALRDESVRRFLGAGRGGSLHG